MYLYLCFSTYLKQTLFEPVCTNTDDNPEMLIFSDLSLKLFSDVMFFCGKSMYSVGPEICPAVFEIRRAETFDQL